MAGYYKDEYPALLSKGLHQITLVEMRDLCVYSESLKNSKTRQDIMAGLELVISRIENAGIKGELLIDGSFLTKKIDADDVDILLIVHPDLYYKGTSDQFETIEWLINNESDPKA